MKPNPAQIAFGSIQSPLQIGALKIPCYILKDQRHVLSIGGIHKIFGYDGKSETWLLGILKNLSKFSKIPDAVLQCYENPMTATNSAGIEMKLIDASLFLETCKILVDGKNNGLLGANLIKVSKIAENILKFTDGQDINALIDTASGYVIFKDEMKSSLQKYCQAQLQDDAALWIKTFPDALYTELFKIHDLDWHDLKRQPETIGKMLFDIVFCRLSMPVLLVLRASQPKRAYSRKNNQPQHNEQPELKHYIDTLMALLLTSGHNWFIFMQLLNRSFPVLNHYDKNIRFETTIQKKELSSFNTSLKKLT